jgi:hypothetical protein
VQLLKETGEEAGRFLDRQNEIADKEAINKMKAAGVTVVEVGAPASGERRGDGYARRTGRHAARQARRRGALHAPVAALPKALSWIRGAWRARAARPYGGSLTLLAATAGRAEQYPHPTLAVFQVKADARVTQTVSLDETPAVVTDIAAPPEKYLKVTCLI